MVNKKAFFLSFPVMFSCFPAFSQDTDQKTKAFLAFPNIWDILPFFMVGCVLLIITYFTFFVKKEKLTRNQVVWTCIESIGSFFKGWFLNIHYKQNYVEYLCILNRAGEMNPVEAESNAKRISDIYELNPGYVRELGEGEDPELEGVFENQQELRV